MVADVSEITGMTGVFVLESDYVESELLWHYSPDPWPAESPGNTLEEGLDYYDRIYLGWFAIDADHEGVLAGYDEWVNAVDGNIGADGVNAAKNVKSSYADFASTNSITDANLADYLGSFGCDITTNTVWAIVDHNSSFGTVPEPATMTLLALGGLAVLRRRRTK